MLEDLGVLGANTEGLDAGDVGGFAAEIILDPLNLIGAPLAGLKAARAGKALANNARAMKAVEAGAMPAELYARSAVKRPLYQIDEALTGAGPREMFTDYADAYEIADTAMRQKAADQAAALALAKGDAGLAADLASSLQGRIPDVLPGMINKRYIDSVEPLDLLRPLSREEAVRAGTEIGTMGEAFSQLSDVPVVNRNTVADYVAEQVAGDSRFFGDSADIAERMLTQTPLMRAVAANDVARLNVAGARMSPLREMLGEGIAQRADTITDRWNEAGDLYHEALSMGEKLPYTGLDAFSYPFGGQAARGLERGAMDAAMESMKLEPADWFLREQLYGDLPRDMGAAIAKDRTKAASALGADSYYGPASMSRQAPNVNYLQSSPGDVYSGIDASNVYNAVAPEMQDPRLMEAAMYGVPVVGAQALKSLYPDREPTQLERDIYPLTMGMRP
jgi:hypothetical protein